MIRKRVRLFTCCLHYSTKGIDAFSTDWVGENNWLVPPVYLISRVIFHLEACSAPSVLVVPKWPSAVFWTIIFPTGGLGHLLFKLLNLPTLPSFLLLIAKAITQFFVHLGLNLWFWPCTSMVPPVFSDLIARYFFSRSPLGLFTCIFTPRFMALSLCLLCTVVIDFVTVVFTMTCASYR